jgi:hypothetical protein
MRKTGIVWVRLAMLAIGPALHLRYVLTSLFGNGNPYHIFWQAVAFSAWTVAQVFRTFAGEVAICGC